MPHQRSALQVTGTPNQGLFGATLGFFIGFAAVALFGLTAARVKDLLGLSPLAVGFLVAMPSLSGSLLRIPFAAWVDTTGGRRPFLVLLLLSIVGMTGLTVMMFTLYPDRLGPQHTSLIYLFGLLSGCGIAIFSVGTSQVSYWFPKAQQGSALGTYAGIGNLAPGIFSLLLPLALGWLDMPGSYLVWLIFLIVGAVLYYFTGRNSPFFQLLAQGFDRRHAEEEARKLGQEMFPSGRVKESLLTSAKTWKTWPLVAIYFTTFGGFMALTSWLPTYWKAFIGLETFVAGALTALYSISASLIRVWGGKIADRVGGEKLIIISLGITLVGTLVMAFSGTLAVSLCAIALLAIGMGISNAAVFKLVPQEVPKAVGGASGWIGGLGAFGGFTLPPLLGAIVAAQGQSGYASGFFVFVLLTVLSIGLAVLLFVTGMAHNKPAASSQRSVRDSHA